MALCVGSPRCNNRSAVERFKRTRHGHRRTGVNDPKRSHGTAYSITSSAVICMISGTVRPSAFAALRLMTRSHSSAPPSLLAASEIKAGGGTILSACSEGALKFRAPDGIVSQDAIIRSLHPRAAGMTRDCQPKRLGEGFEVDDEPEVRRLLDWNVGKLTYSITSSVGVSPNQEKQT
jgi:hypothetical protein